ASSWFDKKKQRQVDDLDSFKLLFREQFSCERRTDKMHEMLYGEPQKSDERGLEFIWRKRRLCQRLYPDWTEDNVISLIKRQMRTEYKVALGPHRYCSINELRAACIDIDELFHDTKRKNYLTPSSNSSSIKNKPKPPNDTKRKNYLTPSSNSSSIKNKPKPPTPSQREVPKCRHCPEKHWHRDCPVLKQKSGEEQRTGPNTASGSRS
ncbi:hypothetical protein QE152_g41290, partial [Popillia japonica]